MGRYTEIYTFRKPLYANDCPVITEKVAVFYDADEKKRVVLCKTRNLTDKTIIKAKVFLRFYDKEGHRLGDGLTYEYEELNVLQNATFGEKTLINTNVKGVYKAIAIMQEVVYSDGSTWVAGEDIKWGYLKLPERISKVMPSAVHIRGYVNTFGKDAKYAYVDKGNLKICTCGAINAAGVLACRHCGVEFAKLQGTPLQELRLLGIYLDAVQTLKGKCNKATLIKLKGVFERLGDYKNSKTYLNKINEELALLETRRKRNKKRAILASAISLFLVAVSVLTVTLIIPAIRISGADKNFNSGKYDDAAIVYKDLDGFGNSEQSAAAIKAIKLLKNEQPYEAVKVMLDADLPVRVYYDDNLTNKNITASTEFNLNEETAVTYVESNKFSALRIPNKPGYSLTKWNYSSFEYDPTSSDKFVLKLIASWEAKKFTITLDDVAKKGINVTLDYNYGNVADSVQVIPYGTKFNYPAPLTRNGYAFAGWYTDSECLIPYTFSGTITEDFTLYAKWVEMETSFKSRTYVNIADHTSSTTQKTFNVSTGTTSNNADYYYFTCYTAGSYDINFSHTTGDYYVYVYNATKSSIILANSNLYNTYPSKSASFTASAGDVIYVRLYNYSSYSSSTGSGKFYVTNAGYPNSSATTTNNANKDGVAYNANSSVSLEVTYDSIFTLPTPEREGHDFTGWYNGNTKVENGVWNTDKNVTLKPRWQADTYTVTLDVNGGALTTSSSLDVAYGTVYTLPTPVREGYTFDGWYYGTTKYDGGAWNTATDVTLVAKWTANTYTITYSDVEDEGITVTYDYNYSGSTSSTVNYVDGDSIAYPTIPTRSGYVFVGWYTDSACITEYGFTGTVTEDITLYAKWVEMSVSNAYNEYQIDPSYYTSDNAYSVSTYGISSYSLVYYFVANEGGEHKLYCKNSTSYYSEGYYITIYNLTQQTYILNSSSIDFTSYSYATINCSANDVIYISIKKHYSSSYYYSTAYFYFEGFGTKSSTATVSSNNLLYGVGNSVSKNVTYGDECTLPTLTREGYTFAGWYNGTTKVESGNWAIASNVTLTPYWESGKSDLTFNANGGSLLTDSLTAYYGEYTTLPVPTKTGYTFEGWYDADSNKYEDGVWNEVVNIALTAQWTANTYTITYSGVEDEGIIVTYDYNYSGSTSSTVNYVDGDSIAYPTIPTRSGYVFVGWYTDSACSTEYDFTGTVTEDITLYAKWAEMSVYYTYDEYQIDPSYYTSDNVYSLSTYGSYSYSLVRYFVANEDGEHKFYYTNSTSSYSYKYYITVYNLTQQEYIIDNTLVGSTSYAYVTFDCSANDVIYISINKYYSSSSYYSTAYFYFEGFEAKSSTATVESNNLVYSESDSASKNVTYGDDYTLPIPTREGYTFVGWYNGTTKVESGTWALDSDVYLTAMWQEN